MADLLIGSGMNRWIILFIMMFIVFIMGMFIDWAAILLITVPIFCPLPWNWNSILCGFPCSCA